MQAVPKERPILFSAPMVRALLDGSKTQTRRVVKPRDVAWMGEHQGLREPDNAIRCPYGQAGDRLWVRETWSIDMLGAFGTDKGYDSTYALRYRADDAEREIHVAPGEPDPYITLYDSQRGDWRPSIHMPRWASRILLEIVSVRVERLQDISEADARVEGVTIEDRHKNGYCASEFLPPSIRAYRDLWESINGAGSWDSNPWVWVVEFTHVPMERR